MAKTRAKVPITRRALIQRINRVLAKDGEVLKTNRHPGVGRDDLGRHYVVDVNRNFLVDRDVDLEEVGRRLKVIAGYETIEEER